jgi:hypothetical protein
MCEGTTPCAACAAKAATNGDRLTAGQCRAISDSIEKGEWPADGFPTDCATPIPDDPALAARALNRALGVAEVTGHTGMVTALTAKQKAERTAYVKSAPNSGEAARRQKSLWDGDERAAKIRAEFKAGRLKFVNPATGKVDTYKEELAFRNACHRRDWLKSQTPQMKAFLAELEAKDAAKQAAIQEEARKQAEFDRLQLKAMVDAKAGAMAKARGEDVEIRIRPGGGIIRGAAVQAADRAREKAEADARQAQRDQDSRDQAKIDALRRDYVKNAPVPPVLGRPQRRDGAR